MIILAISVVLVAMVLPMQRADSAADYDGATRSMDAREVQ